MARTIKLIDFQSAKEVIGDNRDVNLRLFDAAHGVEGLKVRIHATNSGSLVNNRVYKGVHMKDAVDTWTKPYPRPVLTHHADGGMWMSAEDPKGRITKADFTQLRKGPGFDNDFKRPAKGGMGSGFITVEALIVDEDAIAKILDARYLTVSSSQTTEELVCSICQMDWVMDYCGHRAGGTYEIEVGSGKKKTTREFFCYGIAGPLVYRELSFVNVPAQPLAKVLGVVEKDSEDNFSPMVSWSDHNAIAGMALCDAEGKVISNLTDKRTLEMGKKKTKTLVEMPGTEDADLEVEDVNGATNLAKDLDLDNPVTPAKLVDPSEPANNDGADKTDDDVTVMSDENFALATVVKSIKDNGLWLKKDDQISVFDGATEDSDDDTTHSHLVICQKISDDKIVGRTYATIGDAEEHNHVINGDFEDDGKVVGQTRDSDGDKNHTHKFVVVESDNEFDDEVLDKLVADLETAMKNDEDEALSTEQRETLKAKDHCGPNHSFPVSDVAQVNAARQLIARYKGDAATHERISRSIARKATKLGMNTQTEKQVEPQDVKAKNGAALTAHRDEAMEEALLDLATEKAKNKSLESSLTEKSQEINDLQDDLAISNAAGTAALANTLCIVRLVLTKSDCAGVNSPEAFKEKVESYATRTASSLWDAVSDLLPEVDLVIRNIRKNNVRVLPHTDVTEHSP